MLTTIRAKFAAVLLIGLGITGFAVFGVVDGSISTGGALSTGSPRFLPASS